MKLTDSKIKIDIETAGVKKCKKCEEEYNQIKSKYPGHFKEAEKNYKKEKGEINEYSNILLRS